MKKATIYLRSEMIPHLEKVCKHDFLKIIKITESETMSCEIELEYDPNTIDLILHEVFYAGIFYGMTKK